MFINFILKILSYIQLLSDTMSENFDEEEWNAFMEDLKNNPELYNMSDKVDEEEWITFMKDLPNNGELDTMSNNFDEEELNSFDAFLQGPIGPTSFGEICQVESSKPSLSHEPAILLATFDSSDRSFTLSDIFDSNTLHSSLHSSFGSTSFGEICKMESSISSLSHELQIKRSTSSDSLTSPELPIKRSTSSDSLTSPDFQGIYPCLPDSQFELVKLGRILWRIECIESSDSNNAQIRVLSCVRKMTTRNKLKRTVSNSAELPKPTRKQL